MKCVVCSRIHLSYPYNCEQRAKRLNLLDDFNDYLVNYNLRRSNHAIEISGQRDENSSR